MKRGYARTATAARCLLSTGLSAAATCSTTAPRSPRRSAAGRRHDRRRRPRRPCRGSRPCGRAPTRRRSRPGRPTRGRAAPRLPSGASVPSTSRSSGPPSTAPNSRRTSGEPPTTTIRRKPAAAHASTISVSARSLREPPQRAQAAAGTITTSRPPGVRASAHERAEAREAGVDRGAGRVELRRREPLLRGFVIPSSSSAARARSASAPVRPS